MSMSMGQSDIFKQLYTKLTLMVVSLRGLIRGPRETAYFAVLVLVLILRFASVSMIDAMDQHIGRTGDTLLLILVLSFLIILIFVKSKPLVAATFELGTDADSGTIDVLLKEHLELEQQFGRQLKEVIGDTETAALGVMQEIRQLFDTITKLLEYIDNSKTTGGVLGDQISTSVANLIEIGTFINQLPDRMHSDMENIRSIVAEIKDLDHLIDEVRKISMQSHLLAINTGIEASRAGMSGVSFRVIAEEMRMLAANSDAVANKINQGLSRTRHVVEDGMASRISESSSQLDTAMQAAVSIQKLVENFEDMSQYYKMQFSVITQLNLDLADDIANVMGHNQNQDIYRQCIERILYAMGERNKFFQQVHDQIVQNRLSLTDLPGQMTEILNNYLLEESNHVHFPAQNGQDSKELKIELF